MKSYVWLILSLSVLLSACPEQTPRSTAVSPSKSKAVETAPEEGAQPPEKDPLLTSAYVRYPFDEFATAMSNPSDAWWEFGSDGFGSDVSEKDFDAGMDRWNKGQMSEYQLPQHTLVEVLAESCNGHDDIIKIKLIDSDSVLATITKVGSGGKISKKEKKVSGTGLILYMHTDDVLRKGTYKSAKEREDAEAAEVAAVKDYQARAKRGERVGILRFERR